MEYRRSSFIQATVAALCLLIAPTLRAQSVPTPQRITAPVNNQHLVTLGGNVHPLARAQFDHGPASDAMALPHMLLVLKRSPQQEDALARLLVDQQTKSSPDYHQWLTPQQFGRQFGPSEADLAVITNWLGSQGFQVNRVSNGRTVIEFSGTAGQVRQAFHTQIHKYVIDGKTRWANSTNPRIPAALAPVVAGIDSLNNFPRKTQAHILGTFTRSKSTGDVRPLFTFPAPSGTGNYLAVGPGDFATIYNVLPLWASSPVIDGTGTTIAVVAESNINCQDVVDFRHMFGLPHDTAVTSNGGCPANYQIILNGPDPGLLYDSGEEGEAALDAEWAGAIAKNAEVKFVVSETPFTAGAAGVDLSALYIVDNNIADVMTDSYGACELGLGTSGNNFYSALWEQAAAEGITVVVASGDSGSAGCDYPGPTSAGGEVAAQYGLNVSGLASTPYNVAVGGTEFDDFNNASTYWGDTTSNSTATTPSGIIGTSALSYIPELTWNDSCAQTGASTPCTSSSFIPDSQGGDLVGGGGGPSNCTTSNGTSPYSCSTGYAKPSWQSGPGVPNDGFRDIPDVSLFASDGYNGSFYIFCEMDSNLGSQTNCDLATPYQDFQGAGGTSFGAPIFASIMALVNQKTGDRQGNANYVLYKLAAQSGASCGSNASMAAGASSSSCIFYDTQKGNISVACQAGTFDCASIGNNPYGFLSNNLSSASPTPAWSTTAGYDMATGLGTVNVANLINNWNTVTFTSSGTTLTLTSPTGSSTPPITLTHGQSVTVAVNVTPSSATGDVSLIATANSDPSLAQQNVGAYSLSSGAISCGTSPCTTTLLPGGSYNVVAHYAGDGTYEGSDSPPVAVTVTPEPSKTSISLMTFPSTCSSQLGCAATTTPYGSDYVLRVDVTNSAGSPCSTSSTLIPCPSGSITITDNGAALNDFTGPGGTGTNATTLNEQGFLEDQPVQFPAGTHALVAAYGGDNSYSSSTSPTNTLSITKAATSTTVSATKNTVAMAGPGMGNSRRFAMASAAGGPASWGGPPWLMPLAAFLLASVLLLLVFDRKRRRRLAYGAVFAVLIAAFSVGCGGGGGTSNNNGGSGGTGSATYTLTALVSTQSNGVAPGGTVNFYNGTALISGTVTYTPMDFSLATGNYAQLQATLTATFTSTASITASYSGDSNYQASTSTAVSATVP